MFLGVFALTDLAVVALPAVGANALVHADLVDAGASVVARVALAVVDVCGRDDDNTAALNFQVGETRCSCSPSLILASLPLVLLSWQ